MGFGPWEWPSSMPVSIDPGQFDTAAVLTTLLQA
jgi:hypothetical protein